MNVLYTCDNNYVWLMGISVVSLFENNKGIEHLTVYLLGERISDENIMILKKVAEKYNREIIVINVPKSDIPSSLVSARWPLSAFTRLYSGQLLPKELKKVLYLDCDTIIKGSVANLEEMDITDKIVYGVKDCIGRSYKNNIGLNSDSVYVNAGVLFFNMEKLRKVNIKSIIEQYMYRYEKRINYADQDILNGIFSGQIGVLQPKYNVMTIDVAHSYHEIKVLRHPTNFYQEEELFEAVKSPIIIHYTTNMRVIRPWFNNATHPLTNNFIQYLKLSPWAEKALRNMQFISKEDKVISTIMRLPKPIAYRVLGFIHSEGKPLFVRLKSIRG